MKEDFNAEGAEDAFAIRKAELSQSLTSAAADDRGTASGAAMTWRHPAARS